MKKYLLVLLICITVTNTLTAQLSTHGEPYSFKHPVKKEIKEVMMPSIPSISKLLYEDSLASLKGIPPRFGYLIRTNLTTENSGTWTALPDGSKLWRLTISSKGARSINLLYDKFWLPDSSELYIYNTNTLASIGAFTQANNKGTKRNTQGFATGLVYGDKITLEYYQPAFVKDNPIISIAYVVHGYKYININTTTDVTPPGAGFGLSNSCEININCSDGSNYQNEKHAVALIVVGGNRYCTGSLINTTAENAAPYFLTACHCLSGWANPTALDAISNPNANYWTFYWDYESPTCENPSSEITTAFSTSGATVVANYQQTDFALLELTEDPKNIPCFTPYYLGWSRNSSDDNSGGLVCIHHPEGDIKKISLANSAVNYSSSINWDDGVTTPPNTHWAVDFYKGGIEPGSSGSPVLNSSHLVIGQLHGGNGTCSPVVKYYGRFDKSWNGDGSTPQRRLKDWLDPISSNPTTLTGRAISAYSISGPSSLCSSSNGTYSVSGLPAGATVNWSVSPNITSSINGNTITLTTANSNPSSVTLTANIVTSSCFSGINRTMNIALASYSNGVLIDGLEDVYLQGDNINLSVTPTNIFDVNYQWHLNGNLISQGSPNCSITNNTPGLQCGRNMIDVHVLTSCGTTDIDEERFSYLCQNFSILPNPANTILTIQPATNKNITKLKQVNPAGSSSISRVNIYDAAGKLQLSQIFTGSRQVKLNVSNLVSGIYFVEIVTNNGNKEKHKLLIQR